MEEKEGGKKEEEKVSEHEEFDKVCLIPFPLQS